MKLSPEIEATIRAMFEQRGKNEKQQKVERYRRLNAYVQPRQIVFAGSSLMEQFPIEEFELDLDLPLKIYNRGIGGYTTAELLETMGPCIYDLNPAYLFLNIGTNDMNGPDYCLKTLIQRYNQVLAGIRSHLPQTQVFLLAYYPVNAEIGMKNPVMAEVFRHRTNTRIAEANAAVAKLAQENGAVFIDANAGLCDADGNLKAEYTVEGMHMYANGYRAVLQNLLPTLRSCHG